MKKVLAIMLVCFMLVSLLPMGALAAEIEQETPECKGQKHYKDTCENTFYAEVKGECGGYDYNVYTCNACGDYFAADFVKIDGDHDFEIRVPATHSKPGVQVCTICEKEERLLCDGELGELVGNCEDGWTATCEKCGEVVESVEGFHTWGDKPSKIVKEPNEETLEDGLAEYTCTVCGETKEVVILAHECEKFNFGVAVENGSLTVAGIEPTCTEPGMKPHGQCADCGRYWIMTWGEYGPVPVEMVAKEDLLIPATGHVMGEPQEVTENVPVEEWVDTESGIPTADMEVTFTAGEFTGGYPNWGVYVQYYDTDYGTWYRVATLYAGDTVTLTLEAGVEYRLYSYTNGTIECTFMQGPVIIDGDCETESVCKYICAVCGERVEEKLGLNHNWAVTYHTEPTCTTFGYTIESCLDCGEYSIERHDALGHSERPADEDLPIEIDPYWGDIIRDNPVKPTCTEDGYYWWICETCGEEVREIIPSKGCDIITVTVDATCSQYAYSYSFCSSALSYYTKYDCPNYNWMTETNMLSVELADGTTYEIELDGYYNLLSSNIDVAGGFDKDHHNEADKARGEVIEPSCGKEGLIIYWCTDCETGIRETIPALEHEWDDENLIVTEPTCDEPGITAHQCTLCFEIETISTEPFTPEYIYQDYESAAAAHNLENSMKEVFRPGICGEQAALDRYLCVDCQTYILVRDDSYESHVQPEGLLGRDDPNNQATPPADVVITLDGEVTAAGSDPSYYEVYIPVTVPFDAVVTFVRNDGSTDDDYRISGISNNSSYREGRELRVNLWQYASAEEPAFTYSITITFVFDGTIKVQYAGKEPTCTEPGYTAEYYCDRCGAFVESEDLEPTNHPNKIVDVEAKDATCDEAGATEGWHCDDCGHVEESREIPALGHKLVLKDHAEYKENEQYGYEHYICENCDYECIKNYVPVCIHDWNTRPDRDLSEEATCELPGYKAYTCKNCDAVKYEDVDRLHHTNAAGQDLELCYTETEDLKCVLGCKKEHKIPAHALNEGVAYPANCLTNAYIIYTCQNEGCTHYVVDEIEDSTGDHTWSEWAPVMNEENGVIIAESRGCSVCGEEERKAIDEIAYSATIKNFANAEMGISDGSRVTVTISVSGSEDDVWGFHLEIPYSENLVFAGYKFMEGTSFSYAQIATEHEGFISVLANANGDVTLNGSEDVIELYFDVVAPEATEIWVNFSKYETLKSEVAEGESAIVAARAYGMAAKTVELMELDGFEGITLADALALYNLIIANDNTNVAADLDKDGAITLADYLYLFNYLSGEMSYDEIVLLPDVPVEA